MPYIPLIDKLLRAKNGLKNRVMFPFSFHMMIVWWWGIGTSIVCPQLRSNYDQTQEDLLLPYTPFVGEILCMKSGLENGFMVPFFSHGGASVVVCPQLRQSRLEFVKE